MDSLAATQSQLQRLLTEHELSEQLNVEPTLLERKRMAGNGPPFVRISPRTIRYRPEDVAQWLASRVSSGEHAA